MLHKSIYGIGKPRPSGGSRELMSYRVAILHMHLWPKLRNCTASTTSFSMSLGASPFGRARPSQWRAFD